MTRNGDLTREEMNGVGSHDYSSNGMSESAETGDKSQTKKTEQNFGKRRKIAEDQTDRRT